LVVASAEMAMVGGLVYQPLPCGLPPTSIETIGFSCSTGSTTNTVAIAPSAYPSTVPVTANSAPASAYLSGALASHSTPRVPPPVPSSYWATTVRGSTGSTPGAVIVAAYSMLLISCESDSAT